MTVSVRRVPARNLAFRKSFVNDTGARSRATVLRLVPLNGQELPRQLSVTFAPLGASRTTSERNSVREPSSAHWLVIAAATATQVRFTRFGGAPLQQDAGCTVSDDKQSVVCDKTGVTSVKLNLNGGDDVAAMSLAMKIPVFFFGGAGNDGLFGGGGIDVFDGGSGRDNIVSRDGTVEQVNCGTDEDTAISDDGDPAIRPGAREIRGNDVDENCDTRVEPFPPLLGSIPVAWDRAGSGTRNVRLVAKKFLKGATIEVRCTGGGCPSKTFKRTVRRSSENLHAALGSRVLRRGARLEVRVTSASRIGRLVRFRFSKAGEPDVDFLCLPPGGGTRDC